MREMRRSPFFDTFCGSGLGRGIDDYRITYVRVQNCDRNQGYRNVKMMGFPFRHMALKHGIRLEFKCVQRLEIQDKTREGERALQRISRESKREPQEKHHNFWGPSKTEKPAFKETEQDPAKYFLTSQQPLKVIHSCQETSHIQRGVGQLLPFQRNKLVISAPLGLKGPYNPSWRNLQKAKSIYTLEENGSSTLKEQSLTGR